MNKRAITWLLAALLAISAGAAVPPARARTTSAGSSMVWIAQDRAEQRIPIASRPPATASLVAVHYETPVPVRHFGASLYQRPPPLLR